MYDVVTLEARRLVAPIALAALVAAASHAEAQSPGFRSSIGLGGGSDRTSLSSTDDALLVRPALGADLFGATIDLSANIAFFGQERFTTSLRGHAGWTSPAFLGIRGSFFFDADGDWYADGARSAQLVGRGRATFSTHGVGLWIGGGGGSASDGRSWRSLSLLEGGVRGSLGRINLALTAERRTVNVRLSGPTDTASIGTQGLPFPERSADLYTFAGGHQLHYLDAELAAGWRIGTLRVRAVFGARRGNEFVNNDTWTRLEASMPISSGFTAIASGGRLPGRPEQGLRARQFYMFGLRFDLPGAGRDERPDRTRQPPLTVTDVDHQLRSIQIRVPSADRVEIMGDFNGWRPIRMERERGDLWALRLAIEPGVYRANIRVDGGAWVVPPGMTSISDEFDGRVGLLVINE